MAYGSRKGSLGFSFRRAKQRIPAGGSALAIWVHKAGMGHSITSENYVPLTYLELPKLEIVGYRYYDKKRTSITLQEAKTVLNPSLLRTVLRITPRFQHKTIEREIGYVDSVETLLDHIHNTKYLKIKAVTKGKGFSGVIKRRGLKLGKRKRARSNKERHIGCLGSRTGHVSWRAPQPGNMGNNNRTYLCELVSYTHDTDVPLIHYGFIREHITVKGSVPGNTKALIKLYVVRK